MAFDGWVIWEENSCVFKDCNFYQLKKICWELGISSAPGYYLHPYLYPVLSFTFCAENHTYKLFVFINIHFYLPLCAKWSSLLNVSLFWHQILTDLYTEQSWRSPPDVTSESSACICLTSGSSCYENCWSCDCSGWFLNPSDCNISMYIFHTACYFQVWWYCVFLEHSPSISLLFQNNTTVYYLELSLEPTKWIWNLWQSRPKWSFLLEIWQCLFSYLPVTLSPLDQVVAKSFVTLTLKSYVDEMLWCYHSNEKS